MKITDPENVVGKIKLFVKDLELYAKEDKETAKSHPFTDRLTEYYKGRAEAYAFCAKWLKVYLEGRTK